MAVRLHGPLRVFLLTTITIYRHEKRTNAFRVVTITTVTTARVLLTPKQVFDDVNGGEGGGVRLNNDRKRCTLLFAFRYGPAT